MVLKTIMSRAIASARQRRAGVQSEPIVPPAAPQQSTPSGGLTLHQVIALVDTRLVALEKFMNETQENRASVRFDLPEQNLSRLETTDQQGDDITQVLSEYESRFMLLAEEIAQLKDTLMKLQTYTMDVNKMLLEERVNVLSELGDNNFIISESNISSSNGETFELSSTI
jgi:hypothetical protein